MAELHASESSDLDAQRSGPSRDLVAKFGRQLLGRPAHLLSKRLLNLFREKTLKRLARQVVEDESLARPTDKIRGNLGAIE